MEVEDEGSKMDSVLYNMMKKIPEGSPFDNTIKGDFQLTLIFSSSEHQKQTQTLI